MSSQNGLAARSRVDAELTRSGTAYWFENVSDETGGQARHSPSGLICPLGNPGERVLAASAEGARCEIHDKTVIYTNAAAKAPDDATLEAVAAIAMDNALNEPGFMPYDGIATIMRAPPGSGRPDLQIFRYISKASGREVLSRVQIAVVRGWVFTERRDTPKSAPKPSEMAEFVDQAAFASRLGGSNLDD